MNPATDRSALAPHRLFTDREFAPAALGGLGVEGALGVYRAMLLARQSDEAEADLVARGEAFFHVRCTGHEALAAVAPLLTPDDWLHLHYRDKALILARGFPVAQCLHNLLANEHSNSAGRQMYPFIGDRALNLLSQNVPVGNNALQAVGVAAAVKDRPGAPVVVCSLGDGSSQQGEFLEAVAEAARAELPVLFLVEDNRYAISTSTVGRTFFSTPDGRARPTELFGIPIDRIDGRDAVAVARGVAPLIDRARQARRPGLAVLHLDRLSDHTNADDERVYRTEAERTRARQSSDPIRIMEKRLAEAGVPVEALARIQAEVAREIESAAAEALAGGDPVAVTTAKRPLPASLVEATGEPGAPRRTMLEAIREVLHHRLESDPKVSLHGQDIEDPKGDVFGVTRGLSTAFPGRVQNAPLAEATIVGGAIGRAMAGGRPVAFLQFADFVPVAFNQIASELGSTWWRSAGQWDCPVILMVACGGFRPGLGPFHSQTMEALLAHLPGIDVFMPSNADDAAGLLNAAFESGRPTVFLYPKVCLNDPDRGMETEPGARVVVPGKARRIREGNDLTLVAWGSTVPVCERVAATLQEAGSGVDLIDLRSISPWDVEAVVASARKTGRLLVAHEDNSTCGFGAEVIAAVSERLGDRLLASRRVVRPDTFAPCHYANQLEILPSFRRVLEGAAEMLGLALAWEAVAPRADGELATIDARGPSPADQTVKVVEWRVGPGSEIKAGDRIAEMEADKAVFEFVAPVSGTIVDLLVPVDDPVRVGTPLARIVPVRGNGAARYGGSNQGPRPRLARPERVAQGLPAASHEPAISRVALSRPTTALGSRVVTSEELATHFPGKTADDIVKKTGIVSRRRLAEGESALTLAVSAARRAMEQEGMGLDQIDALICSTTTPEVITPSMACLVLHELSKGGPARSIPAHDVLAACTGYLYALGSAHDLIRARPGSRVLVVTAEALSPLADADDFDTAILFGDAATATIVSAEGGDAAGEPFGLLSRPVLSAKGEAGQVLRVPTPKNGHILMEGLKVYAEAVRHMIGMLEQACVASGRSVADLDLIVPHQANARIIGDIRMRLGLPPDRLLVALSEVGNTSSSSIPLALAGLPDGLPPLVGLTAFGGGYTFGAAILEGG